MRTATLRKIALVFGFTSLVGCTVHRPFQSNEGKAQYHLKQAYRHDPSLLDSVETEITLPARTASFAPIHLEPSLPGTVWYLHDTITKIQVKIVKDSVGYQIECDCPEVKAKLITAAPIEAKANGYSLLNMVIAFVMGAGMVFILQLVVALRSKR